MNLIKTLGIKKKGRPKYPVLMPEAFELLRLKPNVRKGRGAGHEHTLYQHLVEDHFSFYNATVEYNGNGKFIDVAIFVHGELIAIEIAMTLAHEKENIEKDLLRAKATRIILCCKDDELKNDAKRSFR